MSGSNPAGTAKNHRECAAGRASPDPAARHTGLACVVELVYTFGLSPNAERIKGSTPFAGTMRKWRNRETRQAQALLPEGVRVRISPCVPKQIYEKTSLLPEIGGDEVCLFSKIISIKTVVGENQPGLATAVNSRQKPS